MTDIEHPALYDHDPQLAPDRFGNLQLGEFLVSELGVNLLARCSRSPQQIHRTVTDMISLLDGDYRLRSTVRDGMSLEPYQVGEYSRLFLVTIGEERYIAKIPAQKHDTPQAPYTQHMKQKQAIDLDLGSRLRRQHIFLPQPLFATEHFYLEEYTDGELPPIIGDDAARHALTFARGELSEYLKEVSRSESELWNNTGIEFVPPFERIHTMRVRQDGSFSWVAPVYTKSLRQL